MATVTEEGGHLLLVRRIHQSNRILAASIAKQIGIADATLRKFNDFLSDKSRRRISQFSSGRGNGTHV
jgi:hypothetical protein